MITNSKLMIYSIIILTSIIAGVTVPKQALAQDTIKTCAGLDVLAVDLDHRAASVSDVPAGEETDINVEPSYVAGQIKIVAIGPLLASRDIRDISYNIACTASGIQITMSIFGSSCFPECSALRNLVFRPEAELTLAMHQTEAQVKAQWIMFLESGALAPGGIQSGWVVTKTIPR